MTFLPGNKFSKGRPKGAPDKRNALFSEKLRALNFDVVAALVETHNESKKCYEENVGTAIGASYLKIRGDMAKEIANYVYAKRKAIETSVVNAAAEMTTQEKLEAAKQMVLILEDKVKDESAL